MVIGSQSPTVEAKRPGAALARSRSVARLSVPGSGNSMVSAMACTRCTRFVSDSAPGERERVLSNLSRLGDVYPLYPMYPLSERVEREPYG
jgi:hypothetical protein